MSYSVEFLYRGNSLIFQCSLYDNFRIICQRFMEKAGIRENNSVTFLYAGNTLNLNLCFKELLSRHNNNSRIQIVVSDISERIIDAYCHMAKFIICPKCGESAKIKIENSKITLYECKNNHTTNNISLEEFKKTQKMDLSKIICNI